MTPDAAGRPGPNTHDFGWIGLNEYPDLYRAMRERALAAESEVTRLRAEVEASAKAVEALREEWEQSLPVLERLYRAILDCAGPLGQEVVDSTYAYYDAVERLHALLAARKGEG